MDIFDMCADNSKANRNTVRVLSKEEVPACNIEALDLGHPIP